MVIAAQFGGSPPSSAPPSQTSAAPGTNSATASASDSNALLNRSSTWPTAWDRQLAPFRSDLAGLEQLLSKRHGQGDSATAAALRSFRDHSLQEIERRTAQLADGAISPEAALDRLRDARTHLSTLLKNMRTP